MSNVLILGGLFFFFIAVSIGVMFLLPELFGISKGSGPKTPDDEDSRKDET